MSKKAFFISITLNLLFLFMFGYAIHQKGGLSFVTSKMSSVFKNSKNVEYYDTPYYRTRVSMFKEYGMKKGGIVFLGDSLIDNNDWSEHFTGDVYNRGIGGDTTKGVLNRLNQITDSNPSKIFIMIGINDFIQGTSKENILDNYNKIVEIIKRDSPQSSIYVHSVLPINKSLSKIQVDNKDIFWLNREIQKSADKEGFTYIDLNALFIDGNEQLKENSTYDGVHLNGKSYRVWENNLKKYLQ